MRVLVTGGAGFIGSHIVDRLVLARHDVIVVDDLSNGRRDRVNPLAALVEHDLAQHDAPQLIADSRPDKVIHAAAQVSVSASFRDPIRDARTNILGTLHVLEGARAAGCSGFLYITTGGALYGDSVRTPSREDDPIAPASPYGLTKWVGERYAELLGGTQMVRIVLRLANVYGPRQGAAGEAGVVAIFAERMLRGQPVEIHGDGDQTRDFVYVEDVVDSAISGLNALDSATVNIGTGHATTIGALFEMLSRLTGYELRPIFTEARAGDIHRSVLSPQRAMTLLGWRPRTTLIDGLALTVEYFKGDAHPQTVSRGPTGS
ncbi:MAG: NAD-dependent epimerase/dehydratase family protein [Candidatus Limnocylindrales bacterium]